MKTPLKFDEIEISKAFSSSMHNLPVFQFSISNFLTQNFLEGIFSHVNCHEYNGTQEKEEPNPFFLNAAKEKTYFSNIKTQNLKKFSRQLNSIVLEIGLLFFVRYYSFNCIFREIIVLKLRV